MHARTVIAEVTMNERTTPDQISIEPRALNPERDSVSLDRNIKFYSPTPAISALGRKSPHALYTNVRLAHWSGVRVEH
jgi:hypothetical protein